MGHVTVLLVFLDHNGGGFLGLDGPPNTPGTVPDTTISLKEPQVAHVHVIVKVLTVIGSCDIL